jgi:SAM-dependent methyltransferase
MRRAAILYGAGMTLHPLAARFAEVSAEYERGRPEYALAVVGALAAELALAPGDPVLDLGAGTGKLTRALLAAGLDVIAVEPQQSLREPLAASVGAERVREGLAERIPLAEHSVYAVTVADAFHWFDQPAALEEIRRVLRPGGGLAILTAAPDWTASSWAQEVGAVMEGLRPEHPHFDGPPWQEALRIAGGWSEPREIRVTSMQAAAPERFLDYLTSVSWVAAMSADERAEKLAQIDALIRAGETPAEVPVHVVIGVATLA